MNAVRMRVLAVLGACAVLGSTSCAAPPASAGEVSVVGIWTGDEATTFEQILDEFTRATGIHYTYTGTRAIDQVLRADVRAGNTPDVAVVASPAQLIDYYQQRQLNSLDGIVATSANDYGPQWQSITRAARSPNGPAHQYAVIVKADLKSIVWYDPAALGPRLNGLDKQPGWAELTADWTQRLGGSPWCMGLGADASSGFPGTDWIEQIMLHTYGPDTYTTWANGALPWQSPEVTAAFRTWGTLLDQVPGHAASALLTRFDDAGRPMFDDPPHCFFDSEGSFISTSYASADEGSRKAGTDYDFFPFPTIGPRDPGNDYEVSANLAGMFNDTPAARRLIEWLASPDGQRLWPERKNGSFSVDRRVPMSVYRDEVHTRIAEILAQSPDKTLCFDTSDLMPSAMVTAFDQAVQGFAADQNRLPRLLAQLDDERATGYEGRPRSFPCGH